MCVCVISNYMYSQKLTSLPISSGIMYTSLEEPHPPLRWVWPSEESVLIVFRITTSGYILWRAMLVSPLIVCFLLVLSSRAFYLPGLAPTSFCPVGVESQTPKPKCQVRSDLVLCDQIGIFFIFRVKCSYTLTGFILLRTLFLMSIAGELIITWVALIRIMNIGGR